MWLHCLATFCYCSKKEIKGAGNPFSLSPSLVNIWLVSEIRPFIVLFYDTFVFQNIITIVSEVKYFGCIILSGVLYQYESQIYTCHLTICHVRVQHRTLRVDFSEGLIACFFLLPFF